MSSHHRIAIVGTGFAGLGMAIRLKQEGVHDFVVLERAGDVGGTWRANTYPGCACDVPSHLYSFSFALNPDWSRTYSPQPEIWDYLRDCSRRYGVEPHIRYGHDVTSAGWDDREQLWRLDTSQGPVTAQVLIAGMGPLAEPSFPDIPGLDGFEGAAFHSAEWDHEHDLTGERVAVIGTGASAIQLVPKIQPDVASLKVFQRTPPWVMPHSDRPITGFERRLYRLFPPAQRLVRALVYWGRELLVPGFVKDQRLMKVPELLARRHLKSQVPDPELRAKVTPDYTIGCKRILPSNKWYPAITEPNVDVVTDGIREVKAHSIVTTDGAEHEVDSIVFGTGFHVTDMPIGQKVRGRGGMLLDDAWKGSPQAYLGVTVSGFPNLFTLIGPNTGLGHNSMVFMIESQLSYVLGALRHMEQRGLAAVEVRREAQDAYNAEIQARMPGTVWMSGCASWYIDENGRNTTIWPDFTWKFRQRTASFDPARYELIQPAPERVPAAA
ncbi:MAG: NAD(P)/FAD-dependent oxidoreductase [Thermoleophilaceae bacterium]